MVEDEARAAPLQRPHDREEEIRWVRGVDNVERPFIVQPERKPARVPARRCVFAEISKGSALGCSEVVTVDVDALESIENVTVTVVARGQITVTSYPALRSARHSCQTRRSEGTERFSTSMSTLGGSRRPRSPLSCRIDVIVARILRGGAPRTPVASRSCDGAVVTERRGHRRGFRRDSEA